MSFWARTFRNVACCFIVAPIFSAAPGGANISDSRASIPSQAGHAVFAPIFGRGTSDTRREPDIYKILHEFAGAPTDGAYATASLIDVDGTLYGTTGGGGTYNRGTVYSITPTGKERVLYNFKGGFDGTTPLGALIYVRGTFYGTTAYGGGSNCGGDGCGTVFRLTTSGKESVLYSFVGGSDGQAPVAALVDINGTLYGTTEFGGGNGCGGAGCGTVFSVAPSGKESLLHIFAGSDGEYPGANLLEFNNALYSTAGGGGPFGYGLIFKISLSGGEATFYNFRGGSDGASPASGLIDVGGSLYGMTSAGGGANCGDYGCGTIYKISASGEEHVLHRLKGHAGNDGVQPQGNLVFDCALFGTTYEGGRSGTGTVFEVTLSGHETVLHSFVGGSDGEEPFGGLLDVKGTLYGTTATGGSGTVFSLKP